MRKKDTMDVLFSSIAVAADAYACVVGFILATWLRFDSGWLAVPFGRRPDLYAHYLQGAIGGTIILLNDQNQMLFGLSQGDVRELPDRLAAL